MILDKLLQCWQRKLSHCELRIQLLECFCGSDLSLQLLGNVPLHRGFAGLSIHMQCLHHVCTMVPACFNSIDMTGEVLNWGMIIAASMRSTLQASMETNEVGMLTGTWKLDVYSCDVVRWSEIEQILNLRWFSYPWTICGDQRRACMWPYHSISIPSPKPRRWAGIFECLFSFQMLPGS